MEKFLGGSKKWWGGVNTENTPGFGTPVCRDVECVERGRETERE